ncbi:MAG: hypothetical protein ABIH23_21150 [bacterium]
MVQTFFVAPFVLLWMFSALIPLILLGLIIYFLVQIKRGIEDLSLEMRDTRETIRDLAQRRMGPASKTSDTQAPSGSVF